MSALIVFAEKNLISIATDTLAHNKNEFALIPYNFTSKTLYLPQFKSCFAVQGYNRMLNDFFQFAIEKVVANDVSSLYHNCKSSFLKSIDLSIYPNDNMSVIFLMGYSNDVKSMMVYKLIINKQGIDVEEIGQRIFLKPNIADFGRVIDNIIVHENESRLETNGRRMIEIMKQQIIEDSKLPIKERVGIGGQLQLTHMLINDREEIMYYFHIAHTFDDFENDYSLMQGV